ncbi:hypothetical protein ACM46_15605 [Chryseobacterium angstadtii]|uniref:Uncharacterized protein n=1 Tax=Chryseobacterium angstadtii TaxID=558151 RepID=A0A0J7KWF0_9FLAO|nr:HNH endonuclease [Chryseobacterium angstadtii]KMQ61445.1 hypothetical protein ACM46_15605 [Chryseobacterium angstadtii]
MTEDGILVHNGCKPRSPSPTNKKIDHSKTVNHPDGSTTYTDINGDSVTYNAAGYPDFSPHAIDEVSPVTGMNGKYSHDEALANAAAGYTQTPAGYVWHHVEDGLTMQLVPKSINGNFPHTGEASGLRDGTLP